MLMPPAQTVPWLSHHTRSVPGSKAKLPKSKCPTSELQASLKIRLGVIWSASHIHAGAGCQEQQVKQSMSHRHSSGCARSSWARSAALGTADGAALGLNLAALGCLLSRGVGQSRGSAPGLTPGEWLDGFSHLEDSLPGLDEHRVEGAPRLSAGAAEQGSSSWRVEGRPILSAHVAKTKEWPVMPSRTCDLLQDHHESRVLDLRQGL